MDARNCATRSGAHASPARHDDPGPGLVPGSRSALGRRSGALHRETMRPRISTLHSGIADFAATRQQMQHRGHRRGSRPTGDVSWEPTWACRARRGLHIGCRNAAVRARDPVGFRAERNRPSSWRTDPRIGSASSGCKPTKQYDQNPVAGGSPRGRPTKAPHGAPENTQAGQRQQRPGPTRWAGFCIC